MLLFEPTHYNFTADEPAASSTTGRRARPQSAATEARSLSPPKASDLADMIKALESTDKAAATATAPVASTGQAAANNAAGDAATTTAPNAADGGAQKPPAVAAASTAQPGAAGDAAAPLAPFTRVPVSAAPAVSGPSPLGQAIALKLSGGVVPSSSASPMRIRQKEFKIFFHMLRKDKPFKLKLPETQTVGDVLRMVIPLLQQDAAESNPTLSLQDGCEHYIFRVGESNGSIDDDIPPLDSREPIGRKAYGDCFVVVPKESALTPAVVCKIPPTGQCLEDVRIDLRVDNHSIRTPVPPDLLVSDLTAYLAARLRFRGEVRRLTLKAVCPMSKKDHISIDAIQDLGFGCGNDRVKIADRTMRTLKRFGWTEFIIIVPSSEPPFEVVVGSTTEDYSTWHPQTCDPLDFVQYREYEVIKINKYGVRQPRVIGIDTERIYNMFQAGGRGQRTKNPERFLSEIVEVRDFPDRPNYFEIEYTRASRYDRDQIECSNAWVCQEIIAKVRYLRSEVLKSGITSPTSQPTNVIESANKAVLSGANSFLKSMKSVFTIKNTARDSSSAASPTPRREK
eukprot:PhM_4_TR14223/c0_g1_i1/m.66625